MCENCDGAGRLGAGAAAWSGAVEANCRDHSGGRFDRAGGCPSMRLRKVTGPARDAWASNCRSIVEVCTHAGCKVRLWH